MSGGGYFVAAGTEKLLRVVVLPKAFYPTAMKNRLGNTIITHVTLDRSQELSLFLLMVDPKTDVLRAVFPLSNCKYPCFATKISLPVICLLKALLNTTDKYIFDRIVLGFENQAVISYLELLLRDAKESHYRTKSDCLHFIASHFFKPYLEAGLCEAEELGEAVLACLFPDCASNQEKFDAVILLAQKWLATKAGLLPLDDRDDPSRYNALLPGHLLANQLKVLSIY